MTLRLPIALGFVATLAWVASAQAPQGTYVPKEKVAAGGTLVAAPNVNVQIGKRTATGEVEVHDKATDTFYVLSGVATFVVGGQAVGMKDTAPGEHRGTTMTGGTTYTLSKGDVMVVPAGVTHWFKEIKEPFESYIVKSIAP